MSWKVPDRVFEQLFTTNVVGVVTTSTLIIIALVISVVVGLLAADCPLLGLFPAYALSGPAFCLAAR